MGNKPKAFFSKRREIWACLLSRCRCPQGSSITGRTVEFHKYAHELALGKEAQEMLSRNTETILQHWNGKGEQSINCLCSGAWQGQPSLSETQPAPAICMHYRVWG